MINAKRTVLTVSLTAVFSTAAWADNQQLAGCVALSDDNHAQQAAEEVRKINAAYFSGSLNGQEIATPALPSRNDINGFSGSLNIPADLQVKGYQPEINQSYDLQSNSNYVLPVSGSLNATDWQIDDSYALGNGHYLDKVFQQDTDTVLLAENTVTDTATDANSGSLNNHQDSSPASQVQNDGNGISGSLNEDNTPIKETANTANATELESIVVTGQRNQSPTDTHKSTLNRNRLTKTATNNGDIGSALKMLPNVRFDNSNGGSMSAGEISPSKISISGSQPYQNAFTIDGIGFNNDLNPGYENNSQQPGSLKNAANGRAQALAVDVNMLEKLDVYDSNIPVYAPSGVAWIDTEIRRPQKDFGFEIKHRYTNGSVAKGFPNSLTKFHVDESKTREELLNRDGNVYTYYDTPEFQKHKTTITVEGRPTEKLGIIGQFQKFESRMPIQLNTVDITGGTGYKAPTPYDTPEKFGQRRERKETQYNATVKAFYDVSDDLNLDFTYIYSPDYAKHFMAGSDNSYYTKDHGGHAFGQTTKWNNPWGKLTNTLAFSRYEDSKTAHNYSDIYRFAMISDNSHWGREEEGNVIGGPVPSESTQTTFSESLKQDFKPFKWGNTEHSISAGFDITLQKAKFGYKSPNFWRENTNNALPMTEEQRQKCIDGGDYRFCDPSRTYDVGWLGVGSKGYLPTNPMFETEEFINPWTGKPVGATTASYLKKGALADKMLIWKYGNYVQKVMHYDGTRKVNVNNTKFDLWVQDKIEWPLGENSKYGKLVTVPGLKLDWEEMNKNKNFSWRFATDYHFPWNESKPQYATTLTAGANRYYGRSLYNAKWEDIQDTLETVLWRQDPSVRFEDVLASDVICTDTDKVDKEDGSGKITRNFGYDKNGNKSYNCKIPTTENSTMWSKLKSPYDDEFMVGFTQDIGAFKVSGKYIHRNGRDQVVRTRAQIEGAPTIDGYTTNYYFYDNSGKSKTDVIALKIENEKPIVFKGIENRFAFAADWTNTKRNKGNYTDTKTQTEKDDEYILWDGDLVRWSERPADNFTKPYTLKFATYHDWKMLGGKWNWSNLFSWTSSKKVMDYYSKDNLPGSDFGLSQAEVRQYKAVRLPSAFTWDTKLGAEYQVYGKNTLFFNIEVDNLLNKRNKIHTDYSARYETESDIVFGTGRSIWLELGYRF